MFYFNVLLLFFLKGGIFIFIYFCIDLSRFVWIFWVIEDLVLGYCFCCFYYFVPFIYLGCMEEWEMCQRDEMV